jgi:hypothetical protein
MSSRSDSKPLRLTWGGRTEITQDEIRRVLRAQGFHPISQPSEADRTYEEYAL